MKKTIFFFAFCFLFSVFCLHAQEPIPDNSFENSWELKEGQYGTYHEFNTEMFYTLNGLSVIEPPLGPGEVTVYRDGNARHGQYCAKLVSAKVAIGDPIFLPGLLGTLSENYISDFLDHEGKVEYKYDWYGNTTPHALEGWFKYAPVEGDSALIDIGFYDPQGRLVFAAQKIIKETVPYWTEFSVVIPKQYRDRMFKDIRILFVASAGVNFESLLECKGRYGSTLWIDNVSLNYGPLGIKQNLLSTLQTNAYPNPAINVLNIELNEHFTGKIMVYNTLGNLIMEETVNGTQSQLNIATLAAGNYVYRLMEGNTIFAQGKFIVAK